MCFKSFYRPFSLLKETSAFVQKIARKYETEVAIFCRILLLSFTIGLLANFLSEGKGFGHSGIVATANSNYELECDTTKTCKAAPEWRNTPPFKIQPTIKKEELNSYLKVFFIDGLFSQLICAEIKTKYKPEKVPVKVSFGTGANMSNSNQRVWAFDIINGKEECEDYNPGEIISIHADPPETDHEYLFTKFKEMLEQEVVGTFDDPDRFFEIQFRIKYKNWLFAMTIIWIVAIYLAPKLLRFIYKSLTDCFDYIYRHINE